MAGGSAYIVHTGVSNLASVRAALERLGARVELTHDADAVREAGLVVLPGVGSFASGMATLREFGLVEPLCERLEAGRPMLMICLGLQLLCAGSEESPDVEGLCVLDSAVTRLSGEVRVPQLGWNEVRAEAGCELLRDGYAYFANSYKIDDAPAPWSCARSEHGAPFVAAIERGAQLACQFHPELSGAWGMDLLRRWWALSSS
jgi:imidazole glycerol phosphate synthase glutamine amidotransferase subunit